MDTTTSHILQKLDAIERAIGELHRATLVEASKTISAPEKEPKAWFSRLRNMSPFAQSLAAGIPLWILGICTHAYLKRGGDPMALIDLALKYVL